MAGRFQQALAPIAALFAVAIVTASCTSPSTGAVVTPAARTQSPLPIPRPTPSPKPSPASHHKAKKIGPGPVHVIARFEGAPRGLVAGPDGAIYDAYATHGGGAALEVVRYVPGEGVTATSEPISGRSGIGPRIAFAGGSVWVVGSVSGTSSVAYRLDATSLAVRARIPLPGVVTAVAAAAPGLWVSSGHGLLRLDQWSGAVVSRVTLSGRVTDIAVDPAGDRLYASTDAPRMANDSVPMYQLDAWSGAVLRRVGAGTADLGGVRSLEASNSGVWISASSGMMGYVAFLPASNLRERQLPEGEGAATNAAQAAVTWTRAWRIDDSGRTLTCLDPSTGLDITRRLTSSAPSPPFVQTSTGIYAGTRAGLARILPPPGCS